MKGSDILKESTIVLDGFTGFTPVQNRLLGELLEVCREVIVTVTMDDRENPYVYKHPYQLFALGKHTVTSLIQIAAERKVSVEAHCVCTNVHSIDSVTIRLWSFWREIYSAIAKNVIRKNREQSGYMWPEIQEKKR